jgi:hypothetical protein
LLSVGVREELPVPVANNSRKRLCKVFRVDICSEICLTGVVKWDRERMALKDLYSRVESASQNTSSNL